MILDGYRPRAERFLRPWVRSLRRGGTSARQVALFGAGVSLGWGALTGFVAGVARETVRHNVTINGLLPGPFDTDRLRGNMKLQADKAGVAYETFVKQQAERNPAGRFGTADEFGAACAFLCSAHAGFISGQNLLMDGGAFPGTL
jgi:NAD(P)-dependent dehydrogenase (short-subunit alcohol dehydrogenase family)